MKALDTNESNITQIAILHFFFNFYYGLFTLTSIDIIRSNFEAKNIMKSYSYIYLLSGLTSFFGNAIIGALSDKFGRKPFLMAAISVRIISQVFLFFKQNVLFLYSTAFFCLIDVGNSLIMVSTADVTGQEERDQGYAIVSAMQPLGFILGPIVSSMMNYNSGKDQPQFFYTITYFSFFLSVLSLAYVYFILPEPLDQDIQKNTKLNINKMNPFYNIGIALCNKSFFMILMITALIVLPQETIQSTYTMFLKNYLELNDYLTSIIITTIALSTTLFLTFMFEYLIELLTHRVTIVVAVLVQILVMIFSSFMTSIL
ncbi:MAG: Hippocampus abundant transcript 1 protein [Marteilia pararefringens]